MSRKFNFMLFSAHLDLVKLRNKFFGKKQRYHLISKYFIFIFAKTYCHLHKKFLLCHPISFDQGFAIANNTFEIIIHVRPGILMLYLPTRWETNIGKCNKNMTLIWRAIRNAKTNNEVLHTPILISFMVLNCTVIFICDLSFISTDDKSMVEMVTH